MKKWDNVESVFAALNACVSYLVIRNYEGFFESVLSDEHADIDILCYKKDRTAIVKLLDAVPRLKEKDSIHYKIIVSDECIPIDIRVVGDGYYDSKWEEEMLRNRKYEPRGFFCMNDNDYFWSLLYHSLYHKGRVSAEYRDRLKELKPGLFPITDKDLECRLAQYMIENNYYYTVANDKYIWYSFTEVCRKRIHTYPLYRLKLFLLKCREFACRVWHGEQ